MALATRCNIQWIMHMCLSCHLGGIVIWIAWYPKYGFWKFPQRCNALPEESYVMGCLREWSWKGGVSLPSTLCRLCNLADETTDHVLFNCEFSHQVWRSCGDWLGEEVVLPGTTNMHFSQHRGISFKVK